MSASGPRSCCARLHPRPCQGVKPCLRTSAAPGLMLATEKLDGTTGRGTALLVFAGLVLGEPAGRPVVGGRVAAARAVKGGDVLQRDEDVPVQLDVGHV